MTVSVDNSCSRNLYQTDWPTPCRTLTSLLSLNLTNQLAIKTEVIFSTLPSHHSLSPPQICPARTLGHSSPRLLGRPKISYQRHQAQEMGYLCAFHLPI